MLYPSSWSREKKISVSLQHLNHKKLLVSGQTRYSNGPFGLFGYGTLKTTILQLALFYAIILLVLYLDTVVTPLNILFV